MSEMKPCPFCGADNGYVDVIPNPFSNDIYSRGHCIKCHAVGTFYVQSYLEGELRPSFEQMAQMATEKWNTRPIEDELRERIAELELGLNNQTVHSNTLQKILTEKLDRIAELEHQLEDWTNNGWAEDYKARIAELEAAQRWIPVDEKPLEAGAYFVRLKNGVTKIDWTFIDGGIYYWWNSGQDSVTHYMPLPQPPEVQG